MSTTTPPAPAMTTPKAFEVLRTHWRLYLVEAALLGLFMISACTFTALLEHSASRVHAAIPSPFVRRSLIGLSMGATAVILIYSRWGRQSGAHMNPAFTLCFLRLGKINRWDAAFYVAAQFVGGITGVLLAVSVAGRFVRDQAVRYVVTVPGEHGVIAAWVAEFLISAALMAMVLGVNRFPRLAPRTGYFAGALIAVYIMFEAPLSGMSMNPARSFGSAAVAQVWQNLWVYFTAPPAGMLAAVELHRFAGRHPQLLCPRLNHCSHTPSIFQCNCLAHAGIKQAAAIAR